MTLTITIKYMKITVCVTNTQSALQIIATADS